MEIKDDVILMVMVVDCRLQPAAAHRDQSQPLEGPKATGSKQQRQVNAAALWQCKGHDAAHKDEHNDYYMSKGDNTRQEQFDSTKQE